uniref:Uncharacterized protein n=1 Tax=Cucumis melo TaxID=3656 RepID=A0A9I9EFM1_CUCME
MFCLFGEGKLTFLFGNLAFSSWFSLRTINPFHLSILPEMTDLSLSSLPLPPSELSEIMMALEVESSEFEMDGCQREVLESSSNLHSLEQVSGKHDNRFLHMKGLVGECRFYLLCQLIKNVISVIMQIRTSSHLLSFKRLGLPHVLVPMRRSNDLPCLLPHAVSFSSVFHEELVVLWGVDQSIKRSFQPGEFFKGENNKYLGKIIKSDMVGLERRNFQIKK